MYNLLSKCNGLENLPISMQIYFLNKMIKPIMLYDWSPTLNR